MKIFTFYHVFMATILLASCGGGKRGMDIFHGSSGSNKKEEPRNQSAEGAADQQSARDSGYILDVSIAKGTESSLRQEGGPPSHATSMGKPDAPKSGEEDKGDSQEKIPEEVSKAEAQQCGDFIGKEVEVMHVSGNKTSLELSPEKALAIKITGNQNLVSISLKAIKPLKADDKADQAPPKFGGICLFLAGNQPNAKVSASFFEIQKFGLIARGNQALAEIDLKNEAKVDDYLIDMSGNLSSLKISSDDPKMLCPKANSIKGHAPEIKCGGS